MKKPRRKSPPNLRRHKPTGQAVVTLNGHDHYLGPWPPTLRDPPESVQKEYDKLIAEWLANGRRLPEPVDNQAELTIEELILKFWEHAQLYYRRADGSTTNELTDYRLSLRPLNHLYADLAAAKFSPLKLKAVRELMVNGYKHAQYGAQAPLARGVVNQRVGRIVRMMKWAAGEELVPGQVYLDVKTVVGLQLGRTEARETEPIGPVPDALVDVILPHVSAEVAAMIQLQRLTGMRPGEVCKMRTCDIDTTGAVWIYRPPHHKMAYRGKARVITIGPRGQDIIKTFLQLDTQAFLFSPRRAKERKEAELRAGRKTKVQPSQRCRKKRNPKNPPGEHYTGSSYQHAVRSGCDKAFPPPEPLAKHKHETAEQWQVRLTQGQRIELADWQKEHRWAPNQLRHSHATEVRRQFGLEAAQVALGHSQASVTQIYAERDQALAAKVAAAIG